MRRSALVVLVAAALAVAAAGTIAAPASAAGIGGPPGAGHDHRTAPLTEADIESYILKSEWTPAEGWPPQECGCAAEQLNFPEAIFWGSGLGGQAGLMERGDAYPGTEHMSLEELALIDGVGLDHLVRVAFTNEQGEERELTAAEALEEGPQAPYLYGEGASAGESSISLIRPGTGGGISSGTKGWLEVVFAVEVGIEGGEIEVHEPEFTVGTPTPEQIASGVDGIGEFKRPVIENDEELAGGGANLQPPKYLWKFGDKETSTEATPKHLYKECGTFRVTVEVEVMTSQGKFAGSGTSRPPAKILIPCQETPTGPTGPPAGPDEPTEATGPTEPTDPGVVTPPPLKSAPPPKPHRHPGKKPKSDNRTQHTAPAKPPAPPKPPSRHTAPPPPPPTGAGSPQGAAEGGGAGGFGGGNAGGVGTLHGGEESGPGQPKPTASPPSSVPQPPPSHQHAKPSPPPKELGLAGVLIASSSPFSAPPEEEEQTAAGSAPGKTFALPKETTPAVPSSTVDLLGLLAGIASVVLLLGLGALGELRPRWLLR